MSPSGALLAPGSLEDYGDFDLPGKRHRRLASVKIPGQLPKFGVFSHVPNSTLVNFCILYTLWRGRP
jgi:hypothetical protein